MDDTTENLRNTALCLAIDFARGRTDYLARDVVDDAERFLAFLKADDPLDFLRRDTEDEIPF